MFVARVTWRDVVHEWPVAERWLRDLIRTRQSW
jgi:hypothetical protein